MNRRVNVRLALALVLLIAGATCEILRERQRTWLRPGLRMYAYVGNTSDGTLTLVDLIRLWPASTIAVGPAPSGVRENPTRNEIWGVSSDGGYAWVVDTHAAQVVARISLGATPFAIDFSSDGRTAYVAASGSGVVAAIDCATRRVIARARVGRRPWIARVSPDNKLVVVANRDDSTVTILDAAKLQALATIPVASQPEQIAILPDSSKAFVSSSSTSQVSVVDLKKLALLTNLAIGGTPGSLLVKPDGGEVYVLSPEAHGLAILNAWTNEAAEFLLLGAAPTQGVLTREAQLYVSDTAAGRVIPVNMPTRQLLRFIAVGQHPGAARLSPGEELLLVVNQDSNDVAVISTRDQRLVTLVPVGRRPTSLAVKMF